MEYPASKSQVAEALCRRVTLETHSFYRTRVRPQLVEFAEKLGKSELGPSGYEVLFGPPHVGAEIMFVGFQPSGDEELGNCDQTAEREPMWPSDCQYAVAN